MERKLLVKVVLVSAASVVLTLLVIVGIAYAADIFTVDKDGTVRLIITDTGNVGVGTGSPGSRMVVHGSGTTSATSSLDVGDSGGLSALFVRDDRNIGIATTSPALVEPSPGRNYLTIKGTTASGALEFATAEAEGDGVLVGVIQCSGPNLTAADKRYANIAMRMDGTTANNRGGRMNFATKADNGAILDRMTIRENGNIGIGTTAPATSAKLDVSSTSGAILIPRMTTAQRDALTTANGMIIYNTSTNVFNFYENGGWVTK